MYYSTLPFSAVETLHLPLISHVTRDSKFSKNDGKIDKDHNLPQRQRSEEQKKKKRKDESLS